MGDSPRIALEKALNPLLPRGWKIVNGIRNIDVLSTTTVRLNQKAIRPFEQAPAPGQHFIEFIVTISTHKTDSIQAEDQLDDDVNVLIHAIDNAGIPWTEAVKIMSDEERLSYEITLSIYSKKD